MTKIKSLMTKIILSVLIILSFFMAQNTLLWGSFKSFNSEDSSLVTHAITVDENDYVDLSSKISNNNFAETSSGSKTTTGSTSVLNPTSWTKTGDVNSENMRAGVISVSSKDNFNQSAKEFLLTENTDYPVGTLNSANGNKVLFINSKTDTVFGYTSNTTVELDANSYYVVSVRYFTGDSIASFGISADNIDATENTIIKTLDSNRNWATAKIFISTKQTQKTNIKFHLYLGAPSWNKGGDSAKTQKGFVLFDDLNMQKLSKKYYDELCAETLDTYDKKTIADEQKFENITSGNGFVENGSFESDFNSWEVTTTGSSAVSVELANSSLFDAQQPKTNKIVLDNKKVAFIYNTKATTSTGYITSNPITIAQNKIYRFSIWAKTNAKSLDFSVQTKETEINGTSYSPATISEVSSSTSNTTTNEWNEYTFYVTGNSLTNIDVTLKLGLKSTNSSQNEYLFIDDITTQLVSSTEQENAQSAGIVFATLNLNPSSSRNISNGFFNNVKEITLDGKLPYAPQDFERVDSNTQNISGIINLEESQFESTKLDFGNPSTKPQSYVYENDSNDTNVSNNVLVMYNSTKSYQTTKSTSSLSANANTLYSLKVNVFTDITNSLGGANLYLTDGTNVLAQIRDINTQRTWKLFTIYFNNYGSTLSLTAQIGFGREQNSAQGFAYFDNFEWDTSSLKLNEIVENSQTKLVNLSSEVEHSSKVILTENFDEYDEDQISSSNKLNAPLLWKGEVKATVDNEELEQTETLSDEFITSGVLNKQNKNSIIGSSAVMEDTNKSVLMISSTTDNYYSYSNTLSYNLTSGSYYRISVKVKTVNLTQETENQKTVNGKVIPYGASIILDGFDEKFVGINTNGKFDAIDGWETFKFYINPDSDIALKVNLGLGSENAWTSGYALFDNVEIIEMSEDEFNLNLNTDTAELSSSNILSVTTTKTNDEEESSPQDRTFKESLAWLAIPTVLIALGIIAAIIGFAIKKYLDGRPVKVSVKNSYDRESTLLQELDHKNYRTSVNHKLKLLREELAQSEQYLKEEQEEHIKQKEAYETAKEIAEQDKSIKLENPDKNYTNYEERINKLNKNIASIKADIKILEDEQEKLNKKSKEMREKDLKGNEIKVVKGKRK